MLKTYFKEEGIEIGVDEAGRGPLFGRVYTAAVILPRENFDHHRIKDSKLIKSKKKIKELSDYIKANSIWSITYSDEKQIDEMNILQATMHSMKQSILQILTTEPTTLLIDGPYFHAITRFNKDLQRLEQIPHECVVNGDNTYTCIAAASILAKVARDEYIEELCDEYPELNEKYGLLTNKGYGTKKHMDGIKTYGITEYHRKSFAPCK
jgi:ribonuclease HII